MSRISLSIIGFKAALRSKQVRENFASTESAVNDLQDQLDRLLTPPVGSEVTNARENFSVLRDRLRSDSNALGGPVLVTGGVVTPQGTPNMTVNVSAGEAVLAGPGAGLAAKWSAVTSGTITAPTNKRFDVVAVDTAGAVSVYTGADSASPVLPALPGGQRALAILTLVSGQTSITSSNIRDASMQGAWLNGKWYWKVTDAVAALGAYGGRIKVMPGHYYEEIDLTGLNDVTIEIAEGARLYRYGAAVNILKAVNSSGARKSQIQIIGGKFYGNGFSGAFENLKFEYTDYLLLDRVWSDGNASSTANGKDLRYRDCANAKIRDCVLDSREWVNNTLREDGLTPLGSITPWHGSLTGAPSLPWGWQLCDGSSISDKGSPFYGQSTPNLNSAISAGIGGYFIRGYTSSGVFEADAIKAHNHTLHDAGHQHEIPLNVPGAASGPSIAAQVATVTAGTGVEPKAITGGAIGGTGISIDAFGGLETKPYSVSMIMIMRIK